jgi:outer membrane protein
MRQVLMMGAAIAAATATPVSATEAGGRWQIKVLATGVLPDGKIVEVKNNALGIPAASQTKADDNLVETICCLTQHHVDGAGPIANTRIDDHVLILPATLTLKYHLDAGPIRPYVGVGPAMFVIFGEKPGATARALGAERVRMSNELGAVLQAGVDVPVSDGGLGISLDAKKYFVRTTLHVENAAGGEVLTTRHKLDPWVVSGGVYFRF